MDDLFGRVAVVTGAASGIGLAIARRLVAEGMSVVLADVEAAALLDAAASLRASGGIVEPVPTDVSDRTSVEALAHRTLERFGQVDVLCNNAGVVTLANVWDQTPDDWSWVLGVDLWGVIHGIAAFLPALRSRPDGGHIVNTASIAGLVPSPLIGPYNVAKAGVVALSETLDMELRAEGVNVAVSVLCPGVVPTRIAESKRNRRGAASDNVVGLDIPSQTDLPPTALSPDEIAECMIDAVRRGRFWVVTHDGSDELVMARARGITSGDRPQAPPVF